MTTEGFECNAQNNINKRVSPVLAGKHLGVNHVKNVTFKLLLKFSSDFLASGSCLNVDDYSK